MEYGMDPYAHFQIRRERKEMKEERGRERDKWQKRRESRGRK